MDMFFIHNKDTIETNHWVRGEGHEGQRVESQKVRGSISACNDVLRLRIECQRWIGSRLLSEQIGTT